MLGDIASVSPRVLNRLSEWAVVHHGRLLAASVLAGLMAAIAGCPIALHWSVGIALLMMATLISLTRVDLAGLRSTDPPGWPRVLLRFAFLPGIIGWSGIGLQSEISLPLVCGALILTAPAATTSVTLSRCAGGLVLPAVGAIYRSSVAGCAAMVVLYQLLLGSSAWRLAPLLLAVALVTILVPCALAYLLRRRAPIATANWGERQASLSVLLLCGFVFFSCTQLDPQSLFPYGVAAITAGLLVRAAAWCISRRGTLRAADDYLSTAYPNLFVVIVLGQLLGFVELTQMATWFLLPMFSARAARRPRLSPLRVDRNQRVATELPWYPAYSQLFVGSVIDSFTKDTELLCFFLLSANLSMSADWPQFRGPRGDGQSDQANLPVRWSATENIAWSLEQLECSLFLVAQLLTEEQLDPFRIACDCVVVLFDSSQQPMHARQGTLTRADLQCLLVLNHFLLNSPNDTATRGIDRPSGLG